MPFLVVFKELCYQNCNFRGIFASIWIKSVTLQSLYTYAIPLRTAKDVRLATDGGQNNVRHYIIQKRHRCFVFG